MLKQTSEFHKNRAAPDGLQWHCIECRKSIDRRPWKRAYDKRRYHEQKETAYLDPYYKRVYGISIEQYKELEKLQNGVCAICFQKCVSGKRLAVDHNHQTNKVRGLLCSFCNQTLGKFRDSIDRFEQAIKYLRQHAAN